MQREGQRQPEFTLDDFRRQLDQITKLGPLPKVLGMTDIDWGTIAGVEAEKEMRRIFGIIDAMTPEERRNPMRVIDQGRYRRIAVGAGVESHAVGELIKQFDKMALMMKQLGQRRE